MVRRILTIAALAITGCPGFRMIAALTLTLPAFITPSSAQQERAGMPTSGGYKPPALSLEPFVESDKTIIDPLMAYARTGDSTAFRNAVESAAASGNVRAELSLAEQYIPEQCTFEPDRDVPHCGPDGKQSPNVIFRVNPLKIPASYEDASQWLEKASAQGSGEASEMLAQLITRMLANGHPTRYTVADSTRLHALARSQDFDVEQIVLSVFLLTPGTGTLTLAGPPPQPLLHEAPPAQSFTSDELQKLQTSGIHGTLHFKGANGISDSVLLSRAEGPIVHIRVILDHYPGHEIHLPIPARHDAIYVQRGDRFLAFPSGLTGLPRFLSIFPDRSDVHPVCAEAQNIFGIFSGICTGFGSERTKPK